MNTLYRMEVIADAQLIKHVARHVPKSARPKLKHELYRLVQEDIVKPVECSTDVNSLVCVTKPNCGIRL